MMASAVVFVLCALVLSLGTVAAYDINEFRQRLVKAYFDAGYTYNLILFPCWCSWHNDITKNIETSFTKDESSKERCQ